MRKISVLSLFDERLETTEFLQSVGVIHVQEGTDQTGDSAEGIGKKYYALEKTIERIRQAEAVSSGSKSADPMEVVEEVAQAYREMERLRLKLQSLYQKKEKLLLWGDFDRDKYAELRDTGCDFFFYTIGKKHINRVDLSPYIYARIREEKDLIYIVFFGRDLDDEIQAFFNREQIPPETLTELDQKINENETALQHYAERIGAFKEELPKLEKELRRLKDELTLQKAIEGQQILAKDHISVLNGWYPRRGEAELLQALNQKGLTYFTANPEWGDDVPVLLRNNKYFRLYEPITRIFQLPNYYELDLTPVIAVFYPIFFAYCLGDAGYGILVMLLAVLGWFTFLKESRQLSILVFILGGLTAVMGIVKSGSVFGIPLSVDSEIPLFRFLSRFILVPDNQDYVFNAFNVALMFGVVQILVGIVASIINRIIYYSFKVAIPQIGKLFIVVGVLVLFLARMQEVESLMPYAFYAEMMIYGGILLVLLFHDLSKSLLSRISSGILPLFFIFTGILGDILSYVRLFALGVASAVLGLVVNRIGMQIMDEQWWTIVLGIVFLIFGHGLNLALAVLGAFVHPLRLTFVEFYNNAGFTGGGKPYEPLKKELDT